MSDGILTIFYRLSAKFANLDNPDSKKPHTTLIFAS